MLAGTHASPLPKKTIELQLLIHESSQVIQDQFSGQNQINYHSPINRDYLITQQHNLFELLHGSLKVYNLLVRNVQKFKFEEGRSNDKRF